MISLFKLGFLSLGFIAPIATLVTLANATSTYYFTSKCTENIECNLNNYPLYSNERECKLNLEFEEPVGEVLIQNPQYNITLFDIKSINLNNYNCSNNLTLVTSQNTTVKAKVKSSSRVCSTDIKCLVIISQIFAVLFTIFS